MATAALALSTCEAWQCLRRPAVIQNAGGEGLSSCAPSWRDLGSGHRQCCNALQRTGLPNNSRGNFRTTTRAMAKKGKQKAVSRPKVTSAPPTAPSPPQPPSNIVSEVPTEVEKSEQPLASESEDSRLTETPVDDTPVSTSASAVDADAILKGESGLEEAAETAPTIALETSAEGDEERTTLSQQAASRLNPQTEESLPNADAIGQQLAQMRADRIQVSGGAEEASTEAFWSRVWEETKLIEWPGVSQVAGQTGIVLGMIVGSSIVLLTLNAVLSEVSDRLLK